jgi:hypothetical protein
VGDASCISARRRKALGQLEIGQLEIGQLEIGQLSGQAAVR